MILFQKVNSYDFQVNFQRNTVNCLKKKKSNWIRCWKAEMGWKWNTMKQCQQCLVATQMWEFLLAKNKLKNTMFLKYIPSEVPEVTPEVRHQATDRDYT